MKRNKKNILLLVLFYGFFISCNRYQNDVEVHLNRAPNNKIEVNLINYSNENYYFPDLNNLSFDLFFSICMDADNSTYTTKTYGDYQSDYVLNQLYFQSRNDSLPWVEKEFNIDLIKFKDNNQNALFDSLILSSDSIKYYKDDTIRLKYLYTNAIVDTEYSLFLGPKEKKTEIVSLDFLNNLPYDIGLVKVFYKNTPYLYDKSLDVSYPNKIKNYKLYRQEILSDTLVLNEFN